MNTHFLNQSLPVNGPRIICGLPRTGTTLIYNLLDCDASHQIFIIEEDFDIMEQIGINITLTIITSQNQIELDAWNYN
jgi:hypothetical protein